MRAAVVKPAYKGSFVLSEDPMVAIIDDVIAPEEMAHVIACASGRTERAKVSLDDKHAISEGRSGGNCWLRYEADPTVHRIGLRIAEIVGIPLSHAEAMQVVHYGPDQEYRAHYDAYDLSTPKGRRCCRYGGQRLVTGLVYLNEVEEGGATVFPKLGVQVDPRPGRLLLFHNTRDDITVAHPGSLHAGAPVKRGEKWAFNIWFHARPMKELQQFESPPAGAAKSSRTEQPSDDKRVRLVVNRASALWRRALDNVERGLSPQGGGLCFTYWDTYGGSKPELSGVDEEARVVQLIDRRLANDLANKKSLARAIEKAGLTHVAPASYERLEDALKDNPPSAIWFVKPVYGAGGKDMFCVAAHELSELTLPANCILQRGVEDLLLDDGRKFTARVYVLIWNGEARLFETGFTVTHGVAYQPGSTDYGVQIDHRGYLDEGSPVRIRPGFKSAAYVEHFPAQRRLIRDLRPILSECIAATDRDRYLLLGIDTLLRRDGSVRLVEINSFPNFIHTPEVNSEVNVPFFEAVIRVICDQPDPRLELLW